MKTIVLAILLGSLFLAGCSTPTTNTGPPPRERPFESPVIFPGDTWQYTFSKAGDYPYMCHPHTWMLASIHVVAPGQAHDAPNVEIYENADGSMGFTPQNLTVEAGVPITWTNTGRVSHSIMGTAEME